MTEADKVMLGNDIKARFFHQLKENLAVIHLAVAICHGRKIQGGHLQCES